MSSNSAGTEGILSRVEQDIGSLREQDAALDSLSLTVYLRRLGVMDRIGPLVSGLLCAKLFLHCRCSHLVNDTSRVAGTAPGISHGISLLAGVSLFI